MSAASTAAAVWGGATVEVASEPPKLSGPRHFLELRDLDGATLRQILDVASGVKRMQRNRARPLHPAAPLAGRSVGLLLSKPSTRTRVSFEVGVRQLGGEVVVLSASETQLGRGESVPDTARVLSRFLDAIVLRTGRAAALRELAQWSSVPVINGLTPASHPVQILADVMTFEEHRGPIAGRTLAWVGDGNNVATSLIEAAVRFGFTLRLATPAQLPPNKDVVAWALEQGGAIHVTCDPREAVDGADCVLTDTWVSMSDEDAAERIALLEPYRVDRALMACAAPDALFMHCLPAHIGDEVTEEVFESPRSVVFDEAENRLHAQKGLLIWSLCGENWTRFGEEEK
ncbi:ornithine carbamoyltransferase [Acetobacter nitrogenifigens DSM 23921 = NBRC 105050]|uniref:Ornithine carbamoyltransferase n=1 Tax=Acetobacter nitrogenifigens DSM 23921 = NBRC 105050 TaxID=1120919 RepID=A0A511X7J3_9PROT|nr:ornithine carbamoyltransferase [Acetobacter nitrogenifigens]GBQ95718.1 ornithine carbamoyltransferase [Acetobacter nitrogenifigens DSM 23921 = NBRC 105050]GEN58917.1 ornithine carbamoyltransferase [Acetobacter nitrogenifigens DSM 23921 = NBRC 105050]